MAYVLKVEYQGELRRILAIPSEEGKLSFLGVEGRVREVLQFPSTSELKLTYQDTDGDIITMANDHDLIDACIIQELNPLRLQVALLPTTTPSSATQDKDVGSNVEQSMAEIVEKLVGLYKPMLRKFFTADQMPEVLNHIVERVKDNINSPSYSTQPTDPNNTEHKPEIHEHITCDLCEMNPIVGPRYKSMKKFNYDLCGSCYEKEGIAEEYKRIQQAMPRPGPASSNLGAVRLIEVRNMCPANMWRAGRGMSPSFGYGPRGGRGRMGHARS